jgi:hypothetical protein
LSKQSAAQQGSGEQQEFRLVTGASINKRHEIQ